MALKPSTAIDAVPRTADSPLASPALSDTHSEASSHPDSEHTTSNFNLGRRYRPTPLPTPALETPGAPPPAFPVPGGLAMTTPAVEGARTALGGGEAPMDEVAEHLAAAGASSASSSSSAAEQDGAESDRGDDDESDGEERVGSTLVRRTTGKGFKVREEHQRSDEERRGKASEKIEASRQKARQAKLEERRGSSPTSAPLVPPPQPLVQPSPQNSGTNSPAPTDSTVTSSPPAGTDAEQAHSAFGQQAQAAGTPEHEKPVKDYKREMRKHLEVRPLLPLSPASRQR